MKDVLPPVRQNMEGVRTVFAVCGSKLRRVKAYQPAFLCRYNKSSNSFSHNTKRRKKTSKHSKRNGTYKYAADRVAVAITPRSRYAQIPTFIPLISPNFWKLHNSLNLHPCNYTTREFLNQNPYTALVLSLKISYNCRSDTPFNVAICRIMCGIIPDVQVSPLCGSGAITIDSRGYNQPESNSNGNEKKIKLTRPICFHQ